jgi:uncharacterized protein
MGGGGRERWATQARPGTAAFIESFKVYRKLLIGGDGVPVHEFLLQPVTHWMGP